MEALVAVLRIILDNLWDILVGGSAELVDTLTLRRMVQGRREADYQFYFRGLINLLAAVAMIPVFLVLLGMVFYVPWLISFAGMVWGLATVFFTIAGTPLAVVIATIQAGLKAVISKEKLQVRIEKYIGFMRSVFLAEAVSTLFLSVFPVKNNPGMLLVVIVAAIVLGLLGGSGKKGRKLISLLAGLVITFGIISFVFPRSFAMMQEWPTKIDNTVAPAISPENSPIPTSGTGYVPIISETKPPITKALEKRDLISFPTKLTKGVWSKEVDLFSLNPFRYHWDISVSDSVRERFSDGTEFIVTPRDTLKSGNRPAIMSFMAFHDGTIVVPSAWNQ